METSSEQTADVAPAVEESSSTTDTSNNVEASSGESQESEEKPQAPVAPAYTPNLKLKVYDQEKELDDPFLKSLIKDADSEKKVKEIAQKAMGFDTVKEIHDKLRTKFNDYETQTQPIVQYYNEASNLLQKGNLEGFFELLQIPDDVIFKYAVKKAEEAQLAPEQQQQIQYQKQLAKERESLANQNQSLQSQQQQQLSQFRNQELGWMLQRPDVTTVQQAFDAKNGPGAFRQAVIQKGLAHYASTNGREDLTAEQAVMEVVKMLGPFVQQASVNGQPAAQPNGLIPQTGAPPIIPNVTGKSSSPVKKQVRSIADIKKRAEEIRSS